MLFAIKAEGQGDEEDMLGGGKKGGLLSAYPLVDRSGLREWTQEHF